MEGYIYFDEIPESCFWCDLNNCHFCNLTHTNIEKYYWEVNERPKDCPILSLPGEIEKDNTTANADYTKGWNSYHEIVVEQDEKLCKELYGE